MVKVSSRDCFTSKVAGETPGAEADFIAVDLSCYEKYATGALTEGRNEVYAATG
jgi:hypothetical protein